MGEAWFYHLTDSPVEVTLPMLLEKSLERGQRVVVRGRDKARLDWLDERLWLGARDAFLPHGRDGGPHDADQPVLLTCGRERANGAAFLMAVDGAEVGVEDLEQVERACVLFDGNDPEAVEVARGQWRLLTGAGARAFYWAESGGRWQKKAESGG
ncbi:DNA polymerase III subunit chi [Frigidibacter sp. ROC022]|uniref:DNA polymerase III subunit chi n=1 Tax=Frigidibacter sp. ROC022 TaxID=2971796 RepID=UPI00215ACF84|nr:DNA polymerase III subunit chi [Frigidibacter sp. ROC022]